MLTISYDDDNMSLMQTNALTHKNTRRHGTGRQSPEASQGPAASGDALPRSQSGLLLHRGVIESLGGELRFNSEDETWTLYARIPCTPTSNPKPSTVAARHSKAAAPERRSKCSCQATHHGSHLGMSPTRR